MLLGRVGGWMGIGLSSHIGLNVGLLPSPLLTQGGSEQIEVLGQLLLPWRSVGRRG